MTYELAVILRHLPIWFSAIGACCQAPALSLAAGLGADVFHRQAYVASAPLQAIKFMKGSELTENNLCCSCPRVYDKYLMKPRAACKATGSSAKVPGLSLAALPASAALPALPLPGIQLSQATGTG